MLTLRDKYHQFGSKLEKVSFAQYALKDCLEEMSAGKPENIESLIKDALYNCGVIDEAVFEVSKIGNELKGMHYRQTDPNASWESLVNPIAQENHNIKLLFIDDEKSICEFHQNIYTKRGFQVDIAFSREEATRKIEQNKPNIIILDLYLQEGREGLEILKFAKKDNPEVKVIVFTNEDSVDILQQASNAGANEILNKPIRPEVLAGKINGLVSNIKR